jgi:hypothetical protein
MAEIRPSVSQGQTIQSQANTNSNEIKLDSKYGVGAWIWAEETHDQQLCRFWRVFEIPAGAQVVDARLRIAVDDSYNLFLDGREIGRGSGWHQLTEYDITLLLKPGLHTVAVEAFNTIKQAGVLAGLQIGLADGRTIEIASDQEDSSERELASSKGCGSCRIRTMAMAGETKHH